MILDLLHSWQGLRVEPSGVFDFGLVGCDCVVAGGSLVGALGMRVCGCEMGLVDRLGREL